MKPYLSNVNQECWKLIKELSNADDFISFLKEIAAHDIKNMINGVDDHSDERLIQEDTVSSLIQVKQSLLPLMTKTSLNLDKFLKRKQCRSFRSAFGKEEEEGDRRHHTPAICSHEKKKK